MIWFIYLKCKKIDESLNHRYHKMDKWDFFFTNGGSSFWFVISWVWIFLIAFKSNFCTVTSL